VILADHEVAALCGHEWSDVRKVFVPVGWSLEQKRKGMIYPFVPEKIRHAAMNFGTALSFGLSECGYDLTLKPEFLVCLPGDDPLTPKAVDAAAFERLTGAVVHVPPHTFALASSVERVVMPPGVVGMVFSKSTYVRCGVTNPPTILEPGWEGHVTLEFYNGAPRPVTLFAGEGGAQVIFCRVGRDGPPKRSYQGKYQNQGDGPVMARV
jgi:dCTP deaminase